jgi:hypothetical protein
VRRHDRAALVLVVIEAMHVQLPPDWVDCADVASVGLGRIVALYYRPSTSYQHR